MSHFLPCILRQVIGYEDLLQLVQLRNALQDVQRQFFSMSSLQVGVQFRDCFLSLVGESERLL